MDKQNKTQMCKILREKLENEKREYELLLSATEKPLPKKIMNLHKNIILRKQKMLDDWCN